MDGFEIIRFNYSPTEEELEWVKKKLSLQPDGAKIPHNFVPTTDTYDPSRPRGIVINVIINTTEGLLAPFYILALNNSTQK